MKCNIVAVGKRRDGGTRYWCLQHKADATAKYGVKAKTCRYAHIPEILESEVLKLKLSDFPGGVSIWGAVPPVYDTTQFVLDRGVHVHARKHIGGDKIIDQTFRKVRICFEEVSFEVTELDAIYGMVAQVFGLSLKDIRCKHCGYPHLDKDWFSVHPHQSHLCAGCGRHFKDDEIAIGNPVAWLNKHPDARKPKNVSADRPISLKQRDYGGGIQVWGSNPALFWTSDKPQETGIHVHAFEDINSSVPAVDNTFSSVEIDGVLLDEDLVRAQMAQNSLPHLENRIVAVVCQKCGHQQFDRGLDGVNLRVEHACEKCDWRLIVPGRLKKVVLNPFDFLFRELAQYAVRKPRKHDIDLLLETL